MTLYIALAIVVVLAVAICAYQFIRAWHQERNEDMRAVYDRARLGLPAYRPVVLDLRKRDEAVRRQMRRRVG